MSIDEQTNCVGSVLIESGEAVLNLRFIELELVAREVVGEGV